MLPSKSIGVGRKFNLIAYNRKRVSIDGYIFTNVIDSPRLRVLMLYKDDVPAVKKLQLQNCQVSFAKYPLKKSKL